jgi:hypothetical protein
VGKATEELEDREGWKIDGGRGMNRWDGSERRFGWMEVKRAAETKVGGGSRGGLLELKIAEGEAREPETRGSKTAGIVAE